jgi:hypothetical protein
MISQRAQKMVMILRKQSIFKGYIEILDRSFLMEFLIAPISESLPFQFLLGRYILDELDAYFLGKKQIFLLKNAEE